MACMGVATKFLAMWYNHHGFTDKDSVALVQHERGMGGDMPVSQDVSDISCPGQLLRYAAAGQLARLKTEHRFLNNQLIAQGAGFAKNNNKTQAGEELSRALREGFNDKQLIGLDEIIGALGPDLDGTGGLSSLALRLSTEQRDRFEASHLTAHVPPSWTSQLLQDRPANEMEVLIQASALLSAFMATDKMDTGGASLASVVQHYRADLELLVRRLVAVSGAPPSARNHDARVLLGLLASYAPRTMMRLLEAELKYSPLGYRVWRAITKLVTLSGEGEQADALRPWVYRLLSESEGLRWRSLYARGALDMELAIAVPTAWSPPEDDWAGDALLKRARNPNATIGERGTAAMGLWQRAVGCGDRAVLAEAKEDLAELVDEFRGPGARPDAPAGIRWVAATLEHVIKTGEKVCNDWPVVEDPWFQRVYEAADELSRPGMVPPHLVTGTRNLFLHMILQNSGVYRNWAIETVVASGLSLQVASALAVLLKKERDEPWLRVRAEAALGLLQRSHDVTVEEQLTDACWEAYEKLNVDRIPTDGRSWVEDSEVPQRQCVSELQVSIYAVGDCFGVDGTQGRSREARTRLHEILAALARAEMPRARILRRPARSAVYLLIVTAQPGGDGHDLSLELLERLSHHPDPVTKRFSEWALNFRFAPGGSVRPLLAAAEYELDQTPFPPDLLPPDMLSRDLR